jgi:type IV secretion system protein VirB4
MLISRVAELQGQVAALQVVSLRADLAGDARCGRVANTQGPGISHCSFPSCAPQGSSLMLNLAEYRKTATGLCDYLPWACLVAPGIVLNKDGSFQRSIRYRGPDLDSATEAELVSVSARLNNVLRRFGAGWALFFEAERVPANQYPGARFADPASWLVDQERFAAFSADGAHHESRYTLTFLYLPPPEHERRVENFFFERRDLKIVERDAFAELEMFETETGRALELLTAILPEAEALTDAETLTHLHGTISTKRHPVAVPTIPTHLDALLCDVPFLGFPRQSKTYLSGGPPTMRRRGCW